MVFWSVIASRVHFQKGLSWRGLAVKTETERDGDDARYACTP